MLCGRVQRILLFVVIIIGNKYIVWQSTEYLNVCYYNYKKHVVWQSTEYLIVCFYNYKKHVVWQSTEYLTVCCYNYRKQVCCVAEYRVSYCLLL